ncbi:MAG: L,D-transpeptidase [Bdellovibrio sp.]
MMTHFLLGLFVVVASSAAAPQLAWATESIDDSPSVSDEINPFDPHIERVLNEFDQIYQDEMGQPTILPQLNLLFAASCYRQGCPVYAYVSLAEQRMYLYLNGQQIDSFLVSSGAPGHSTPSFDRRPNGRIYDRYTSTKYPEGDYRGLGNMPYAVFIEGGFAIHGTTEGNFARLGTRASHGCIRVHPDKGYKFNRLVRQFGISQTWITIQ